MRNRCLSKTVSGIIFFKNSKIDHGYKTVATITIVLKPTNEIRFFSSI